MTIINNKIIRIICVISFIALSSFSNAQNFKEVKWIQNKEFIPLSDIIELENKIYTIGKNSKSNLFLFRLDLKSLDTAFLPINNIYSDILKYNFKIYHDRDNDFILLQKSSNNLYQLRKTESGFIINKIEFSKKIDKLLSEEPFDNFYASKDSFYFYYSHSPSEKDQYFSKIFSVSRSTYNYYLTPLIKEISGSFLSIYSPFNLVNMNQDYLIWPLNNLSQIKIQSKETNNSNILIIPDYEQSDSLNYLIVDEIKRLYIRGKNSNEKLLEDLDTLNAKINKINNILFRGSYLIIHHQKKNLESNFFPKYFINIYKIREANDKIDLIPIFENQVDFIPNTSFTTNKEINPLELEYTNLMFSKLNFTVTKNAFIISDFLIENPLQYKSNEEINKELKKMGSKKVFSVGIYYF